MMSYNQIVLLFLSALPAALLLTVIACRCIIPILRKCHIGQNIYTEGPAWHASKQGTPTMGGICFILAMLVSVLPFVALYARSAQVDVVPLALTLALGVGNAMVGFVDDFAKLLHKQNKGLSSLQKLLLQTVVAIAYVFGMAATGHMNTVLSLEVIGFSLDLGVAYYAFAVLLILAMVNSTNLTDGLDGLASSVTLVAAMCFSLIGFIACDAQTVVLGAALIGAMIGFLFFNYHPAKVFMGDTGSLYLGGILVGMGLAIDRPILTVLISLVFILDMLSSLIQIISYKLRKKRVFLMAPVHHHFEKKGWSEEKIVYVFSGTALFFGVLAVIISTL
ncbi:MAG: phospho-N-acetylmuramoyl-pentapeptide-transferase [Clostridia bacterium]|nr:phospho-N-acetylmuramoyl-pentapeptide-transferase [Clostridia bacterium]